MGKVEEEKFKQTKEIKERFKQIATSHLFLIRDNKILLLRRFNTGYEDGRYSVVAGHIEGNETARQTMVREAYEEAGIKIDIDDLEVVHMMHRNEGEERVDFFFTAKKWEGEPRIMETNKCDDLGWFEMDKLPSNTIPYIKKAIDCFSSNKIYSEYGWEISK